MDAAPPAPVGGRFRDALADSDRDIDSLRQLPAGPKRKQKLRELQKKWHPDKHEVLKEVAEEVTKMINEAVDKLEGGRK